MIKKTHIFPQFSIFLALLIIPLLGSEIFGQEKVFENGRPTLNGLDAEPFIDTPTRQKIDLSGEWDVVFRKKSVISGLFDTEIHKKINVPASIDFEGKMTFRKNFEVTEGFLKKYCLKFVALGINYESEVYVNDVFIGKHIGGYTGFELEIPDDAILVNQKNVIQINVNSELNASNTLPVRKQIFGWKNYGGILRDIYLLASPRININRVRLQTNMDDQFKTATINLSGVISSRYFGEPKDTIVLKDKKEIPCFVKAELFERFSDIRVAETKLIKFIAEINKDIEFKFEIKVNNPKLWKPDSPELYLLKLSAFSEAIQGQLLDQYNLNTGFSNFHIKGSSIILNGDKIFIKGIIWHEDVPLEGGSLTYEQMEKDVVAIKSLGANAIRFIFHPPHPYMLNLCSRYGLIVLEEVPVWNVPADILVSEQFITLAKSQTREMIERDSHYPCVFAWGIGSQFDSSIKETEKFLSQIVSDIRNISDKPIYYSTRFLTNDACLATVDFVGIELLPLDLNSFKQQLTDWKRNYQNKPVVVLSYGKDVEHSNRNGFTDPMSQEAQARFYIQCYTALKEHKVAAGFINAYADWRGDRPLLSYGEQNYYISPFGLLSQSREKRIAYDVVRSLYNDQRTGVLPAGKYKKNFPWIHIVLGFIVILVVGYELTDRRFSQSLKRALFRTYNFFVDLRDLRAASVIHTLIVACLISVTLADIFSGILYHFRTDKFADYVLTYLLVLDPIKENYIYASWKIFEGIGALFIIFFLLGILFSIVLKILALITKTSVRIIQAYSIITWGAAPILILSPLAMILFRTLENSVLMIPSVLLILILFLWCALRILKGISVVYDFRKVKVYLVGISIFLVLVGGLFLYYESVYSISAYSKFVFNLSRSIW